MTSSSSSSDEFYLLENSFLKLNRKLMGIHPINKNRKQFGEYHHLFKEIKEDESRFFQYLRMSISAFNDLMEITQHKLIKNWCNWHKQPILPEEKLVITLR